MESKNIKHSCIVVLGDWGRSPRMQYHSISLANKGYTVDVIAYKGAKEHEEVQKKHFIRHHYLRDVPSFQKYCPRLLVYILKTLWQSLFLFISLMTIEKPLFVLIQNPPSIPTLPIVWLACCLRGIKFVIDFHNYGYSILALTLGSNNRLVKICEWCEGVFGRKTEYSFCVSRAMKDDLIKKWNIRSTVFYDCPPNIFKPISCDEQHLLFVKLSHVSKAFQARSEGASSTTAEHKTRFTEIVDGNVKLLDTRPSLIVSSTSWTEDEDFFMLLEALCKYEKVATQNSDLPFLVVTITGKGPLKSMYEKLIEELSLERVEIVTLWLEAEDYPKLLASADLGVCLHKSSSGLDLPMKIVDMFGCGLPTCAFSYPCVHELVKPGINGLLFSNSGQLASQLQILFDGFPKQTGELSKYRENLMNAPRLRWDDSWDFSVFPILEHIFLYSSLNT